MGTLLERLPDGDAHPRKLTGSNALLESIGKRVLSGQVGVWCQRNSHSILEPRKFESSLSATGGWQCKQMHAPGIIRSSFASVWGPTSLSLWTPLWRCVFVSGRWGPAKRKWENNDSVCRLAGKLTSSQARRSAARRTRVCWLPARTDRNNNRQY